ncbi:hypothetical protein WCD74_01280 [Actinomycetospora sp. OC33-EN08]|uniref:Uncharacterized protein n=1 Tax=Actinomycetospora aurantiaca TaxID=3129233 RepID=A0ABU8MHC0_9PSEU
MDTDTSSTPSIPTRRRRSSLFATGAVVAALLAGATLPGTAEAAPAPGPAAIVATALAAPTQEDARPRNGALLTKRGSGSGSFTVDNSRGSSDAVVTLSSGARATLVMYVRSGQKATASKVPDGRFDVFVERGQAWNSAAGRFDRTDSTGRFDRQAGFTTKRTSRGTSYSRVTLTLHQVANGNTTVLPVPATSVPS